MKQNIALPVLQFWFDELVPKQWFVKDPKLDALMISRFGALYAELAALEPQLGKTTDETLASIIVLDQFPRNMFRGTAKAFATDRQALMLSKAAMAAAQDQQLEGAQKAFLYMPIMHSENTDDQALSLRLFSAQGLESNYRSAVQHKAIIDRFGRFVHRNAVLGRQSTKEEEAFLRQPGSGF